MDERRISEVDLIVKSGSRVLFGVSDVLSANSFLKEFLVDTAARGAEVRWFAGGTMPPAPMLAPTFVHIPALKRTIALRHDLAALRQILTLMRAEKPSVVHLSTPKAALLGMIAAWICRVPTRIYLVRGLRLETAKGPSRLLLWCLEWLTSFLSTDIVCVSKSIATVYEAHHLAPQRKLAVFGEGSSCGVITARFIPTPERRAAGLSLRHELGIDDDRVVVGYVGRINTSKGVEDLLMAFADVRQTHKVALVVLGDLDPGEPLSTDAVSVLNGAEHVYWLPFAPDPAPIYHAFDIFVLATYREGFPNVVLEAGSAGLPVITTDATGAVDSVIPNVTGLRVPTGNVAALASAMARLADDPKMRQRLGTEAQKRCIEDFERDTVVLRYVDHLVGVTPDRLTAHSLKGSK